MKIIIRYCSQWGNMSTKTCTVNSNIKVAQLKQQIAQLTDIREEDQTLILNEHTLEDSQHLFNYNPEDCQFIYVNRENQAVEDEAPETEVIEAPKVYNRMKGYEKLGIVHEDSEEEDENRKKSMVMHKSQIDTAAEFIKVSFLFQYIHTHLVNFKLLFVYKFDIIYLNI